MRASVVLLAVGVLCGLWDALFGVRLTQAGKGTLKQRAVFAWQERRMTIAGSALVLASVLVELL